MSDLRAMVDAEFENIERILREFPSGDSPDLSTLEIAGTAALLHNIYNAVENILKQTVLASEMALPTGDSWHRDLLSLAGGNGVLSLETVEELKRYLAFRHFFSHGYAVDLEMARMAPLVSDVSHVCQTLREEIYEWVAHR